MLANGHWCYCNNGKQGRSCHNLDDQPLDTKACSESTCLNGGKCLAFNTSGMQLLNHKNNKK